MFHPQLQGAKFGKAAQELNRKALLLLPFKGYFEARTFLQLLNRIHFGAHFVSRTGGGTEETKFRGLPGHKAKFTPLKEKFRPLLHPLRDDTYPLQAWLQPWNCG